MEKLPSLSATAVPIISFPLNRVTVEFASAVPVIVGEELFVIEEEVARDVGAFGTDVSMVMEIAADFVETLPAESVEVALIEYSPSEIENEGVNEKAPLVLAVVVPKAEESIKSATLELASALPVIVGVESFVIEEEVAKEVGASGTDVSMVMEIAADFVETLPAESVEVALIEYSPSEIAEEGVKEKAPLVFAVVVPKAEESIKSVTLELASAIPVIVGVGLFVIEEEVARELGASGAVVSMVMEIAADFVETLPAESVEVAFIEYSPSSRGGGVTVNAPLLFAFVVTVLVTTDPLYILSVTLELASAFPVNVGVELLVSEVLTIEVGASGAVVSGDEFEPLLPGNDDFPANVSKGIKNSKPKVENNTADLYRKINF